MPTKRSQKEGSAHMGTSEASERSGTFMSHAFVERTSPERVSTVGRQPCPSTRPGPGPRHVLHPPYRRDRDVGLHSAGRRLRPRPAGPHRRPDRNQHQRRHEVSAGGPRKTCTTSGPVVNQQLAGQGIGPTQPGQGTVPEPRSPMWAPPRQHPGPTPQLRLRTAHFRRLLIDPVPNARGPRRLRKGRTR
jgi:hypothetical protein